MSGNCPSRSAPSTDGKTAITTIRPRTHRIDRSADKKLDVWQGTLALMVFKTLEGMGPLHGFGLARRIEHISGHRLVLNPGTLYPTLLKLEQAGFITSAWGTSTKNRRARFYRLTRRGRKQILREAHNWGQTIDIMAQFLAEEAVR